LTKIQNTHENLFHSYVELYYKDTIIQVGYFDITDGALNAMISHIMSGFVSSVTTSGLKN